MLKKLILESKTKDEIEDFIFKLSPYSDKNNRWKNFLSTLYINKNYIESMSEVDKSDGIIKQKFFIAWFAWDNKILYAGTAFVPEQEFTKGISLSDYEKQATL